MRNTLLALAVSLASALPLTAQVGSPLDPGGSYVGPFGPTAAGGTPAFAQTFTRSAGLNYLQSFSFFLGDNNSDASGSQLQFEAAVFEMNGSSLGNQLFVSQAQSGSANYSGFDTYSFATPNLFLDPSVGTFALVLRSISSMNGALNVIGAGATDIAGGAFWVVNADNSLSAAIDGTSDAAFDAMLTASQVSAVPEPSSLVLLVTGLSAMLVLAVRKKRV